MMLYRIQTSIERAVPLPRLETGMQITRDIHSPHTGHRILARGSRLSVDNIQQVQDNKLRRVFIKKRHHRWLRDNDFNGDREERIHGEKDTREFIDHFYSTNHRQQFLSTVLEDLTQSTALNHLQSITAFLERMEERYERIIVPSRLEKIHKGIDVLRDREQSILNNVSTVPPTDALEDVKSILKGNLLARILVDKRFSRRV